MKTLLFFLLLSSNVHAAALAECRVAVVDFNKSHSDVKIYAEQISGVQFVLMEKDLKNSWSTRQEAEISPILKICIKAGFHPWLSTVAWKDDKQSSLCQIILPDAGLYCHNEKVEHPRKIKVMEVLL